MRMFEVRALFLKPEPGAPMRDASSVIGKAGHGLVGDCSGHPASPRQVLVVAADAVRALGLGAADLRANLVVAGDLDRLGSGTVLDFGGLRLRITIPCEPCAQLDKVRPGLSRDVGLRRGLLARVVASGTVALGGRGEVAPDHLRPLAASWKARVQDIVAHIPAGKLISYAALTVLAGVQTSYCRALPGVLKSRSLEALPVHRVVPASIDKVDAAQLRALRAEGIDLRNRAGHDWDGAAYYAAEEAHGR